MRNWYRKWRAMPAFLTDQQMSADLERGVSLLGIGNSYRLWEQAMGLYDYLISTESHGPKRT